jgi:chemotaxis protein methyltransferase CheR
MNPDYLKRAKAGVYALSSLKEIPEQLLSESFKRLPGKKQFKINPSFQKGIIWLEKNIFSDPPVGPFHIIFLRNNLLTYYKVDLTGPVINRIIGSLFPGAYLVTGSHEKLPSGFEKQLEPDSLSYVYKKIK